MFSLRIWGGGVDRWALWVGCVCIMSGCQGSWMDENGDICLWIPMIEDTSQCKDSSMMFGYELQMRMVKGLGTNDRYE